MVRMLPTGPSSDRLLAGFTLIEVLVVLVIMAAVVSSISYVTLNKHESLKDLTGRIVQQIRLTRQLAVRTGKAQQFAINLGDNTFDFAEDLIELPAEVSITVNTAENQLIDKETVGVTFFPDASSSGGNITLEAARQTFKIFIVWISGKVTVSSTIAAG